MLKPRDALLKCSLVDGLRWLASGLLVLSTTACSEPSVGAACSSSADCAQKECVAEMCIGRSTKPWGTIPNRTLPEFQRDQLAALAGHRVFFGHQSVGGNILDGFRDLGRSLGVDLALSELASPEDLGRPGFVHALNGKNEDPRSKIDAFARTVESGVGERAEAAFFKFCYVDFNADTQVDELFAHYQATMARLEAAYPKTRFVHVTVPLTVTQGGVSGTVKRLLGRNVWGESENFVRERFNEKLRSTYAGKQPLFDLAVVEATTQTGELSSFEREGQQVLRLVDSYAYDGQHLNEPGRKYVAARLTSFLATLLRT